MAVNSRQKLKPSLHGLKRILRFDVLEDRRVMAALDVFVFDDLNGSRSFDSASDSPLREKPVFLDLNRDGSLSSSEPWTVTDSNGVAHFKDLDAGNYTVRLLGSNSRVVQSFPTAPASQEVSSGTIGKVVRVEANGATWAFSSSSLSLFDNGLSKSLQSIDFENSMIVDAVFEQTDTNTSIGYVLTRNASQAQQLWSVSNQENASKTLIAIDASNISKMTMVGDQLLIQESGDAAKLSLLRSSGVLTTLTGISTSNDAGSIKSVGPNGFAILDTVGASSWITMYQLNGNEPPSVMRRSFPSNVLAWESSPDGKTLAVSTVDDFFVLDIENGLQVRSILKDAVEPILFDSNRDLLITGTKSNTDQLVGWSTSNWAPTLSIPISQNESLTGAGASLRLDPYGRFLVGSKDGRAYQYDLAAAAIVTAVVTEIGTTQVQIGIRLTGRNVAPVLRDLGTEFVNEDEQFSLDPSKVRSSASDGDGDSLVYVIRNKPSLGSVSWSSDGRSTYIPASNANGHGSIVVQAYDGIEWSNEQSLDIEIVPVNDVPTGILSSVNAIDENPSLQSVLAQLLVQDPDSDSDYEYQINDPRFSVVDGILRLIAGAINFEKEAFLFLPIMAVNRARTSDRISQTLTLRVNDQNDAPTGIVTPKNLSVPERTKDVDLGGVSVVDEDANLQYSWAVSDPRFEIVAGVLRLTPNTVLDFETEPSIVVTLTGSDPTSSFAIDKSITITVTDQDDPPSDLIVNNSGTINQNERGATVGLVQVVDVDQGETYSFAVSDNRFEVRRGVLSLKPGLSLDPVDSGYLDLTVTATSDRTGLQVKKTSRLKVFPDPTPYHNDNDPYDVDGDGKLTPLDPLLIINHINNRGIGPLPPPGEGEGKQPGLDVDGDGSVTPLDILILINRLNRFNQDYSGNSPPSGSASKDGNGMPKAEGESTTPVYRATDMSLASYIADVSDEIGTSRLRRR
ncbi:MAG: dockerin type I domain-containing protein [Planctomycetota bacterium]|nr:dockerin type I domain-containing protein [Planctomycetota bacterium]